MQMLEFLARFCPAHSQTDLLKEQAVSFLIYCVITTIRCTRKKKGWPEAGTLIGSGINGAIIPVACVLITLPWFSTNIQLLDAEAVKYQLLVAGAFAAYISLQDLFTRE